MKNDLQSVCLSLVRSSLSGSSGVRTPRPVALGWKLQSSMLPPAELSALYESLHGALRDGAANHGWAASAALRALLAEYHAVRRGGSAAPGPLPTARCRRVSRPASCA